MTRRLHLNVNILHAGFSPAAWRAPEVDPRATFDVGHYVRCARIAERGKLDAVFLADTPAITDRIDHRPALALEPTIVLAAIAAATERIGLIATVSTTFNEPYNIARRFATLDHASRGRTGINLVTNADPGSVRNFGLTTQTDHAWRYERAGEFAEVLKALWDSWDDDAVVADKAAGRFVDLGRVRPISWRGKHLAVEGPFNLPRPPQGHPVILQAGGSADIGGETRVSRGDVDRLRENPQLGFETRGNEYLGSVARIEFNLENPYLKDLRVRQAIAHAIDRNVILDVVYYGHT